MTFRFYRLRFNLRAREAIHFAPGKAGNILRGAFGYTFRQVACPAECASPLTCPDRGPCAYVRTFEPRARAGGPSGLADWPRPFVFRASHLDGRTINAGGLFHFDMNYFDAREPAIPYFEKAFAQLACEGLGPGRARAVLAKVDQETMELSLKPRETPVRRLLVRFRTPTELKQAGALSDRPEFGVLLRRIRDRLSTLRELYGDGPLDIEFPEFGRRADQVIMTHCQQQLLEVTRLSSRTGQRHSLGGYIGEAVYEGDLRAFLPYLEAAQFTGVGRQTTWGKGEIEVIETPVPHDAR